MDKKNVQKWIPRNLFVKKRAALGKFFGVFGRLFSRPFMMWKNENMHFQKWDHAQKWRQNGPKRAAWCPKIGGSCFRKKCFRVLRTWCKMWHVLFWAFLVLEKSWLRFGDVFSKQRISFIIAFTFIIAFIWVEHCPWFMVHPTGALQVSNRVRYGKCKFSAKRIYHWAASMKPIKRLNDFNSANQFDVSFFSSNEVGCNGHGDGVNGFAFLLNFSTARRASVVLFQRWQQTRHAEFMPACRDADIHGFDFFQAYGALVRLFLLLLFLGCNHIWLIP